MVTAVRAVVLASLMFLPTEVGFGVAQATRDAGRLEFLGFRAGARIEELNLQLRNLGGRPLRCRRSRADSRVSECRGVLRDTDGRRQVEVWVSAVDSLAGVMTLSGMVDSSQLDKWRQTLQESYGRVAARVQGTQRMLQWVRRGRMIRLTWRVEGSAKVASVSLVDGHVLDNWGRAGNAGPSGAAAKPTQPQSRIK
jgi:hypothetical protein